MSYAFRFCSMAVEEASDAQLALQVLRRCEHVGKVEWSQSTGRLTWEIDLASIPPGDALSLELALKRQCERAISLRAES